MASEIDAPDWGYAYEEAIRERIELLTRLRSEGSTALQRVPGTCQSYLVRDLDDDEIRSVAIYEAEVHTNTAIRQSRTKHG